MSDASNVLSGWLYVMVGKEDNCEQLPDDACLLGRILARKYLNLEEKQDKILTQMGEMLKLLREQPEPQPTCAEKMLVHQCNNLAHIFYRFMGRNRGPSSLLFYKSTNQQEQMCWDMAVAAFKELRETDIKDMMLAVETD